MKSSLWSSEATRRLLSDPGWYFRSPSSFFMDVKQDKCETHVSSHTRLAIDLQAWCTTGSSHRAATCHKSLSPWIIARDPCQGTPLRNLKMIDGKTQAEQSLPSTFWQITENAMPFNNLNYLQKPNRPQILCWLIMISVIVAYLIYWELVFEPLWII